MKNLESNKQNLKSHHERRSQFCVRIKRNVNISNDKLFPTTDEGCSRRNDFIGTGRLRAVEDSNEMKNDFLNTPWNFSPSMRRNSARPGICIFPQATRLFIVTAHHDLRTGHPGTSMIASDFLKAIQRTNKEKLKEPESTFEITLSYDISVTVDFVFFPLIIFEETGNYRQRNYKFI